MDISNAADFPTYAETYAASYGETIVSVESVGSRGAALISFRRPPGRYRHDATSDFAVTMIQSGGSAAQSRSAPAGSCFGVAPGQLVLTPPFIATDDSYRAATTGVVVALCHTCVAEILRDVATRPEVVFRDLYTQPVFDDFIRVAIDHLMSLDRVRRSTDILFADGVISAIFAALARHGARPSDRARRRLAHWQLRRVLEKLESLQDVSLVQLAEVANLSPFYFARAFKQTTGLPPHHFQQRLRVERAKALLTDTTLPVTEIALQVGYGSSQTLARVFRRNVGSTPAEFRRRSKS